MCAAACPNRTVLAEAAISNGAWFTHSLTHSASLYHKNRTLSRRSDGQALASRIRRFSSSRYYFQIFERHEWRLYFNWTMRGERILFMQIRRCSRAGTYPFNDWIQRSRLEPSKSKATWPPMRRRFRLAAPSLDNSSFWRLIDPRAILGDQASSRAVASRGLIDSLITRARGSI